MSEENKDENLDENLDDLNKEDYDSTEEPEDSHEESDEALESYGSEEELEPEEEEAVMNPFPGLRPFKIEESHLFFGREGQSDEVLLKLSKNRFVGVIGPSGSGKSSFVYCGVLPILYGGFLTDVSADWEVVVMRPGAGPIDNLAESLLLTDPEYLACDADEKKVRRTIFSTLLRSSSLGLVEAIKQFKKATKKNYLVLVDQFEELFRFKDSREKGAIDETLAFINLLLEAVDNQEVPAYVAITMRSDFIGECAQFADLTKKINDSHYLIPQMTREQKRRAIEGPVAVGGAEITSRLVQRLLNDLGDNPDQLPILQHSLMRTWDYWTRYKDFEDEPLDIKHYEAIGTMSEALSLHANEAFDELDEDQKRICESLFKAITEKRGESFGIRRPTRLSDIAAISHSTPKDVAAVIEKFREPGRSLLTPAHGITLTPKSVIDISHESLMRIWVRLKNWVDDEFDAVQMYMRLAEAASMYQLGKAGLWRPPDLQLALNWESKHKPTLIWAQRYHPAFERTMEFLSHSKKEYETEQRIKELQAKRRLKTARVTAMVMAGLCVVAIGFLLYAFDQQTEAIKQSEEALRQRNAADSAAIEATAQKVLADSSAREALLRKAQADSAALVALQRKAEADSAALVAQQQSEYALEQQGIAVQNADRATAESIRAQANADTARINAELAAEAAELARKRQYQSLAKAIALRSQDFTVGMDQFSDIKGLLAQQAYLFNTEYEGYAYDGDVYNGLYFALKHFKDPMARTQDTVYRTPGDIFLLSGKNLETVYSIHESGKILGWIESSWTTNRSAIIHDGFTGLTVKDADLSDDNRNIVLGGRNATGGYAVIINLSSKEEIPISGLGNGVIDLVFAPNNDIFLLDNYGESIKVARNGAAREIARSADKLTELAITSDGKFLYAASTNGKVFEYDIANGNKATLVSQGHSWIGSLEVSEDGSLVAFGDKDGVLWLYNTRLKTESGYTGHEGVINAISFSYDGKFLATASSDKTVRLWNLLARNNDPIELKDHTAAVSDMVFTSDNSRVIAGTRSRAIKVWPAQIEQMSGKICTYVTRNMDQDEWNRYIGEDLEYERTCENIDEQLSGGE